MRLEIRPKRALTNLLAVPAQARDNLYGGFVFIHRESEHREEAATMRLGLEATNILGLLCPVQSAANIQFEWTLDGKAFLELGSLNPLWFTYDPPGGTGLPGEQDPETLRARDEGKAGRA